MADNTLLEKLLDLPEFNVSDLQHNDYDIRIYVSMKEKLSVGIGGCYSYDDKSDRWRFI